MCQPLCAVTEMVPGVENTSMWFSGDEIVVEWVFVVMSDAMRSAMCFMVLIL